MNLTKNMLDIRLDLFDGGAAAGAGTGAAASGDGASSAQGETQAASATTRRGKSGEYKNVLFGKQPAAQKAAGAEGPDGNEQSADAGRKQGVITTSDTLEAKRQAYRDLVNGEYKDIYAEDTQRIINRRFREAKDLEQQMGQYQPLITMLMQRYQIGDGDVKKLSAAIENDDSYWAEAAEEAGMSVDQYKQFQKLQRDNEALRREAQRREDGQRAQQQLQKWYTEAEKLKESYPSFDLDAESERPEFLSLLKSGVPVKQAYEVLHMDEIVAGAEAAKAQATEKQIVDSIRAKGARPQENGTAAQSAFVVKDDVSKFTKKDRAEIARRAARGEIITL